VSGLYNAGVNLVYAACGIYRPEHIGVVQLYGAAATAETKAQAIARAERDFAAVAATLAGFAQSKLEPPALDVVRWYIEFLSAARKPLLLLGHPDPRVKRRAHGRDGALPEEADDLSLEQNEILFRGLAKLRENFVFQVVSDHVPRGELVRYLEDMARLASNFASRRRGSKSVFRGREITHPEIAEGLCRRLTEEVADLAIVDRLPKLEGRNMTMILTPKS